MIDWIRQRVPGRSITPGKKASNDPKPKSPPVATPSSTVTMQLALELEARELFSGIRTDTQEDVLAFDLMSSPLCSSSQVWLAKG